MNDICVYVLMYMFGYKCIGFGTNDRFGTNGNE